MTTTAAVHISDSQSELSVLTTRGSPQDITDTVRLMLEEERSVSLPTDPTLFQKLFFPGAHPIVAEEPPTDLASLRFRYDIACSPGQFDVRVEKTEKPPPGSEPQWHEVFHGDMLAFLKWAGLQLPLRPAA